MQSAVSGLTSAEAPSAGLAPSGRTRHCSVFTRQYSAYVPRITSYNVCYTKLLRICLTDGIGLVNIVRRTEQEELLRASGAVHVCNSSSETFEADLTEALAATGASIAFDALGGGTLADQILRCMESVLIRDAREYSRYGSPTHKQIYLYGGMDSRPRITSYNVCYTKLLRRSGCRGAR